MVYFHLLGVICGLCLICKVDLQLLADHNIIRINRFDLFSCFSSKSVKYVKMKGFAACKESLGFLDSCFCQINILKTSLSVLGNCDCHNYWGHFIDLIINQLIV